MLKIIAMIIKMIISSANIYLGTTMIGVTRIGDVYKYTTLYRDLISLDRSDVSLPSHRWTNSWQPLKNIVTNGWLTEKPSKNHWSQWLSRYHSIKTLNLKTH